MDRFRMTSRSSLRRSTAQRKTASRKSPASKASMSKTSISKTSISKASTTKASIAKASAAKADKLPEWNLSDLYAAIDAPEVARDLDNLDAECVAFESEYKGE